MKTTANKKLSFYQWLDMEYGITKQQYPNLSKHNQDRVHREYKEFQKNSVGR